MKRIAFVIVACLSIADVKNEGCRVGCVRDGYNSGKFSKNTCLCYDQKGTYSDYIHQRMAIGPQPDAPFVPENRAKGQTFELTLPSGWTE